MTSAASFLRAIEDNNASRLRLLVALPGSVHQRDIERALVLSAKKGFHECILVLQEVTGCHPDVVTDSSEKTALIHAAEAGHMTVVQVLLDSGCHVNHASRGSYTAVHAAAKYGHTAIVQTLLSAGANINYRDDCNSTPLISAAKHRKCGVLSVLAANPQCDLNAQDDRNKTALHYACQLAVGVDILVKSGACLNIQDCDGNTPLHIATLEGFDNVVDSLVSCASCNKDFQNSSSLTAVHIASMKNHDKAVSDLANAGADVNVLDGQGRLPLWYAVNHNRHRSIKELLRVNSITEHEGEQQGANPLQTALGKGLLGVAKLLILADCKLDALYPWMKTYEEQKENRLWEEQNRLRLFVEESSDSETEEEMATSEAYEWFLDWVHQPHTLRQQCRINIRRFIGQHILRKAGQLPLPRILIDYITLKEVEDHPLTGSMM